MGKRIEALRRKMMEGGADAVLVSLPFNRRYISGLTATDSPSGSTAGWALITQTEALLLVGFLSLEQARRECPDFTIVMFTGTPTPLVAQAVRERGIRRLACEGNHLAYLTYVDLKTQVGDYCKLIPFEGWIEDLRALKDETEVGLIRRAAKITDQAFEHVLGIVRPGVTERELAWEAERYMREAGAEAMAFEIGLASGPNTSIPHARPTDRRIQAHEPIWIDMGAQVDGYCADLTRTFCLGEPDEQLRRVWNLVHEAQRAALERCRPGMGGRGVDSLARGVIADAGHGAAFGHGLGHGVGLAVHERPRLGQTSTDVVAAGMVATFEPGVYLEGWGGVRIEDLGVIREEGVELLSSAMKQLVIP